MKELHPMIAGAGLAAVIIILYIIASALSRIAAALERIAWSHTVDYSDALADITKAISKPCEDCGAENSVYDPELNGRYCAECRTRHG